MAVPNLLMRLLNPIRCYLSHVAAHVSFSRVSVVILYLVPQVTPGCTNLLTRLLDSDPELRISVAEALQHPWIAADVDAAASDVRRSSKVSCPNKHSTGND